MSVLYVRPASDIRFVTEALGVRSISHTYTIKSDVVNETKATILACGLLPVFGYSPHPQDLGAICSKMDIRQNKEGSQFWTGEAEWRTHNGGRDPQNQQKDPDQRRPVWRYSFQPISKYLPADLDGKLFQDRAGTPFDPPPERAIWIDEVTIERYETTLSRKNDRKYLNARNTDTWLDAKPGEAFIANITADEVFEFGRYWFKRVFTVLVSPRVTIPGILDAGGKPFIGAWDYECVLNQGSKYIPAAGPNAGKPQPIVQAGFIDGRPQLLDLAGAVLPPGTPTAQNVYLQFRLKNKATFATLNLKPPY